jgi:hypothetical protein
MPEWQKLASSDEDAIREWWSAYPNANVGIVTGVESGVFGIDVDIKNERGDIEFAKLQEKFGEIPPTLIAETATGGFHLYFRCTTPLKNRIGMKPGIDVRAAGGQLVAPPSITPKGQYTWKTPLETTSVADAPQWIIDMIQEGRGQEAQAVPEIISEGSRNALLTSLGGTMRRRGFAAVAIEAALLAENNLRCNPPLAIREVRIIANSVSKYASDDPALAKISTEVTKEEWEKPQSFLTKKLPEFPIETLPQWLQDFCVGMSDETQTPIDMAAVFGLTMCSTAVARKFKVHLQHNWYQPLNLYNIVVMRSGSGKSPVYEEALRPIGEYEQKLCRDSREDIEKQNDYIRVRELRRDKLYKDRAKATQDTQRELIDREIDELTTQLAVVERLYKPQLVLEDTTAEALASAVHRNDGRIAVLSDEGDGVLENMSGRYSKSGSPNFEIYLKGHSGEPFRVNRIGRPDEYVPNPSLTVGLAVQPVVLSGMWLRPGFSGKGLLARFWYFIPEDKLGRRDHRKGFLGGDYKSTYYRNILRLLCTEWDGELSISTFDPFPRTLDLSPGAHSLWLDLCEWIEPELQPLGKLGELSDWGGKFAGIIGRVAAILHLAKHVHELECIHKFTISELTMENAIRIGKHALEHSLVAFGEMRTDTATADARKLLRGIKKHGWEEFTRSDAMSKLGFRGNVLDGALAVLLDFQYVKEADRDMKQRGRPARRFITNPHFFEEEWDD